MLRGFILVLLSNPTSIGPAAKEYAMQAVLEALKNNPVRIYSIVVATLALIAFYIPTLPVALVLGLVAAILGVGEGVRAVVTPTRKLPTEG
jgi:hypothetical protein